MATSKETGDALAEKVQNLTLELDQTKRKLVLDQHAHRQRLRRISRSDSESSDDGDRREGARLGGSHQYCENPESKARRERRWAKDAEDAVLAQCDRAQDPREAKDRALIKMFCKPENRDLLKQAVQESGLEKELTLEIVLRIEEEWEVSVGAYIQDVLGVPNLKYKKLRRILARIHDEDRPGHYKPREVSPGVKFPLLPSLGRVDTYRKELWKDCDPRISDKNEAVTLALPEYMRKCITAQPLLRQGARVLICIDGGGLAKKTTQVTCSVDIKPSSRERTPAQEEEYQCFLKENNNLFGMMCYAGVEKREQLEMHLERLLEEGRKIHKDGGLWVDGVLVPVTWTLTPDKKMKSLLLGHAGSAAKKGSPCDGCLTPWEFLSLLLRDTEAHPDRTIESCFEAAHLPHDSLTFPHTCKHCKKVFQNAEEMRNEEEPADLVKFQQTHTSMYWHVGPLFEWIPLTHWPDDVLHTLLNVTKACWDASIASHMASEASVTELNTMVHDLTGCFIKTSKVSKAEGKQSAAPNFIGREARELLCNIDKIIEWVFTHNTGSKNTRCTLQLCTKLWDALIKYWVSLCAPWSDQLLETRDARAAVLRDLGKKFLVAFIAACTAEKVTMYVHDMPHHIPDQVNELGNLWECCAEGMESIHALTKRLYITRSNRQKGSIQQIYKVLACRHALQQMPQYKDHSAGRQKEKAKQLTDQKLASKMPLAGVHLQEGKVQRRGDA